MAAASVSVTGGAYDQESTEATLDIDLLYSCLSINLIGFLVANLPLHVTRTTKSAATLLKSMPSSTQVTHSHSSFWVLRLLPSAVKGSAN